MAGRPEKHTVDYFPHFTKDGKTLFILESQYRNDGYAFWFKLLTILSATNNHIFDTRNTPDWQYLLAKTLVTEEMGKKILDLLASLDAIDPELWSKGVIWCQNLVDNFTDIYKKRNQPLPVKPNIMFFHPLTKNTDLTINVPDNSISGDINPISDTGNTHTKVKERKVKESKVYYTPEIVKPIFYSFQNDGYSDIVDFDNQFRKFCEYWFEGTKQLKLPKLACHNWLDNARERQQNRGVQNGINRGSPQPHSERENQHDTLADLERFANS